MSKILLVDDNPQNIELLTLRLEAAGHDTIEARNGEEALDSVAKEFPDLMILDLQMPKMDGLQVLKRLQDEHCDLPVIVISAFATVERAVEAMKAGALDFITKPFDPTHLELVVERALERTHLTHQNRFLNAELNARYHFVLGSSQAMAAAYESMLRAANTDLPLLIQGENGTGNEVAARVIHKESERSGGPFIAIRCGAMSGPQLAEDLFGNADHKGKIELAANGTLFLDEVSKLSAAMQEKLVELISTKGFTREGGSTSIPAEVRVMVASTIELSNAVAEGTFLEELLNTFDKGRIKLPPLGERREDIPELVNYFVEKTKAEVGREMAGVSDAAMEALSTYHWPGNVRELANVIEGAVSTGRGDTVEPADLGLAVREVLSGPGAGQWTTCSGPYEKQIKEARRHIVMAALREAEGETAKAAEALEMDAAALDNMLGELGIRR